MNKKIIIFASGEGTNAQAVMDYCRNHPKEISIVGLVSNNSHAPVLTRAKKNNIPTFVISHKDLQSRLDLVTKLQPDWAFLLGYMRIMEKNFLELFVDDSLGLYRVINIHPSLLPAFSGKDAYQQAFAGGVKVSGLTIHFVEESLDGGPIIAQTTFPRKEDDTFEDFYNRGRQLEIPLLMEVLSMIIHNNLHLCKETKLVRTKRNAHG